MKVTNIIRITVFAFLIAGIATVVTYRRQFNVTALQSWLASAGVMAPLCSLVFMRSQLCCFCLGLF